MQTSNCSFLLLIASLSLVIPAGASAAVVTTEGHQGDGIVDVNGLGLNLTDQVLRAGVGGNNVRGIAPIFFFALPHVSSPAHIAEVEFEITYLGFAQGSPGIFVDPEFNVDLFGIGTRATPTIQNSDYYDGIATGSSDSLIRDNLLTPTTGVGRQVVSDTSLLNFIRAQYQLDGTPVQPFVVFRANPDKELPVFSGRLRGYNLASADNPDPSLRPQLSITVVPEPSALLIWIVLAFSLAVNSGNLRWRFVAP